MASTVKWRKAYDGKAEKLSLKTGLDFRDSKDRAIQSAREDADINVLVRRFGVTGNLPKPNLEPFYGDFSEALDYQSALDRVRAADEAFMGLSADIRNKFDNDPGRLLAFLHDERNRDQAREMGLLRPQDAPPAPIKVEMVNPPTPPNTTPPAAS